MNIEIPNYEVVKNLGWRRREAGMGGDIFIQIYTGVSTRPSTSRPLLAAYAVQAERLRGLRRTHVPVPRRMYAYMDYYSKEGNANLNNYFKSFLVQTTYSLFLMCAFGRPGTPSRQSLLFQLKFFCGQDERAHPLAAPDFGLGRCRRGGTRCCDSSASSSCR